MYSVLVIYLFQCENLRKNVFWKQKMGWAIVTSTYNFFVVLKVSRYIVHIGH